MSYSNTGTCNWCLREASLQTIEEKLWRFWGTISPENPPIASLRKICGTCRTRYEEYSKYIDQCKSNESVIDVILTASRIKTEPLNYIECETTREADFLKEDASGIDCSTASEQVAQPSSSSQHECWYCDKTFSDLVELNRHLRVCDKRLICPQCDKAFTLPGSLMRHLHDHVEGKNFECAQCGKKFNRAGCLKLHAQVHTGYKRYDCERCDKGFATAHKVKSHMRVHTGEKPLSCTHCDKTFASFSALKHHLTLHHQEGSIRQAQCPSEQQLSSDKVYSCNLCDKTFSTVYGLNGHSRVHMSGKQAQCDETFSGDKLLKCTQCDKTFTKLYDLKGHLITHTWTFSCTRCDESFTRASILKAHMMLHLQERSFKCRQCDKTFTNCSDFKAHKTLHEEKAMVDETRRARMSSWAVRKGGSPAPLKFRVIDVFRKIGSVGSSQQKINNNAFL